MCMVFVHVVYTVYACMHTRAQALLPAGSSGLGPDESKETRVATLSAFGVAASGDAVLHITYGHIQSVSHATWHKKKKTYNLACDTNYAMHNLCSM